VTLSLISLERLEEIGDRAGLSRNKVLDLLVRGASIEAAVEVIQDRFSTDMKAVSAWQEAGG